MSAEKNVSGEISCDVGCCTKIKNLSAQIGGTVIIRDVNLHFHCGEFTVICGRNGAGKTTLLRAIAGEIRYGGTIDFQTHDGKKMRPRIGYVPQKVAFDLAQPLTVEDLFAISLSAKPRWLFNDHAIKQKAKDALGAVGAAHLISKKIGHLSGGELQRVILSLALTPCPNILLLDEPTTGIDADGLHLFYEMISELRKKYHLSIVMVSHDVELSSRFADRVVTLDRTVVETSGGHDV